MTLDENTEGVLATLKTGSRAYGMPKTDSDTDIVVYCTPVLYSSLASEHGDEAYEDTGSLSIRDGQTNYIVTHKRKSFEAWERGTARLLKEAPVTRERAIEVFKEERAR